MLKLDLDFEKFLSLLKENTYTTEYLFKLLDQERTGLKRKPVIVALQRVLVGNTNLCKKSILSSIKSAETRRRRRIVKNAFKNAPIWAMEEIRKHYPEYKEDMLSIDLKPKAKKPKRRFSNNFRDNQLAKIIDELKDTDPKSKRYHWLCNKFAWHSQNRKKEIFLMIRKEGFLHEFSFPPHTKESAIKRFVTEAQKASTTKDNIYDLYKIILTTRTLN